MDIRLAILATLLLPTITLAGSDYLVGIPGLDSGATDFNQYINAVYAMFIGIAALLAVIKIIVAGVKYMFSDIVTQKSDAKKDIRSALLGLLIVLGAVLILTVINPDLTNFDVSVERQEVREVPDGGGSAADLSVTLPPVDGTEELGYRFVSTDDTFEQRMGFIVGCGGQIVMRAGLGQIRCYEIDPDVESDIRTDLATLDEDLIETTINQYEYHLGERVIEDPDIIAAIETEWEAYAADDEEVGVLFVVQMPAGGVGTDANGFGTGYEAQVAGVCETYQEANPDVEIDLVIGETSQNYAACVRIN